MPDTFARSATAFALVAGALTAACGDAVTTPRPAQHLAAADASPPSAALGPVLCTAQTCLATSQIIASQVTKPHAPGPDGSFDLVVLYSDGWFVRRLTSTPHNETHPVLSPDRRRVAYVSDSGGTGPYTGPSSLWVRNVDGTGAVKLVDTLGVATKASWSPDGKRLAFIRKTGAQTDIWTVNADGTGLAQVSNDAFEDHSVAFAADGNSLYVSTRRQQRPNGRIDTNIWQYSLAGQPLRLIAGTERYEEAPTRAPNGGVAWAQNNNWLEGSVYLADAVGGNAQMIAKYADSWIHALTFSPDGKYLVFQAAATNNFGYGGSGSALWKKVVTSSAPASRITSTAMRTEGPSWTQ